MVLLTPLVTLVVHAIDTDSHPTVPAGWRWAVMAGVGPPGELVRCANAGWAPDRAAALLEGEMVAVTAVKALRMFGVSAGYRTLELEHDPIPAGGDRLGLPV